MYRHRVLESYGFNLLHMSYHDWERCATEERRYDYLIKEIALFQGGILGL
eukprot:TRINITY_DN8781_c0_g1_i1.p3 TRINITY_DN8781_c0_g1~~TRINITY_DN8781_c0_g1_i1.p3  ORF type:complete len:50 (-),score=0.65 TRINITY_DN8781_c0_g1_i1:201-350(-)